ncbi:MAG: flavodoxin family protein [Oscillospiraceae bacterium]|jgi:multimeric flavodoxin WrbA|nr:flavodoxin family protein [Oscillospiraceae bacterium]
MKYLILSGNPKDDGLCKSAEDEIARGARDGGAVVERLTFERLVRCQVCGDGWGLCRKENRCAFGGDGFDAAQSAVREADRLCIITPTYWAELAESLKCFLDRLRRCEFGMGSDANGALAGKPILLVASPGGSGNGAITCLDQMGRFCQHTGAKVFDHIIINRWNCDYKRAATYAAARAMAEGRNPGDTL